jgi:hypothetical protein
MAVVVLVLAVGMPATASATTASTTAPCEVVWGSGPKSDMFMTDTDMVGLRAGRHECHDRLVFDLRGPITGYWVSYVDAVTEDPTGRPVPLRGGARLMVAVFAAAHDDSGTPTYTFTDGAELVDVTGYRTLRQVAWAGSWEGTTSVGVGVRARLPMRVFTLPDRIVVDVAHTW